MSPDTETSLNQPLWNQSKLKNGFTIFCSCTVLFIALI